jgi:predicted dehydrogenase
MQPRTSKPLRVALAGAGMISWYHMVGWRKLGERVRVVAVCDPDPAKACKRADEFGIPSVYTDRDAMLSAERLDALDVASPRETHAEWVDAAVARGIDVLCQKPMTPTLAESHALVRRVEDAGKSRLMVHENCDFVPGIASSSAGSPRASSATAARADGDDHVRSAAGRRRAAASLVRQPSCSTRRS